MLTENLHSELEADENLTLYKCSQADENLRLELEADVEEECVKLGPVDSVKVI
jgi:hypothetical protein